MNQTPQPMRGRSRAAGPAVFFQIEPVAQDFCFQGYFLSDQQRGPQLWRRDGSWALRESVAGVVVPAEKSPYDLIFNNTKV